MTYKISVFKDGETLGGWKKRYQPWWINFLDACSLVDCGDESLDNSLQEWNCRNIAESVYIEFTSDADAAFFLLRFS